MTICQAFFDAKNQTNEHYQNEGDCILILRQLDQNRLVHKRTDCEILKPFREGTLLNFDNRHNVLFRLKSTNHDEFEQLIKDKKLQSDASLFIPDL